MNTDFVILPAAKSGNSVKLKAKNIQTLHMETRQLEKQNQVMEQTLNQLRESMSREKEERERSNGYHWKSGQVGNLGIQNQSQNKENVGKVSSGRIKFRVLKDQPPEPEKPKAASKSANTTCTERPKIKGKACGQCETKTALLTCVECGEDYCTACFAKMHQKGALKLHRTMPIQGKSQASKLDVSHQMKKELNFDESREKLVTSKDITGRLASDSILSSVLKQKTNEQVFYSIPIESVDISSGTFLHGTYNEEESAKSFHDALMEWRNKVHGCTGNSEVQTISAVASKPIEFEFKESGISYMEKLMLKKHRRTPVNPIFSKLSDNCRHSPTLDDDDKEMESLTAEEMERHERFAELFKPEEFIETNVIQEPALKIVELYEAPEDDLEETRGLLVSEVDEINIQRSFPDTRQTEPTKKSDTLPVLSFGKRCNIPLQTTFSIDGENTKTVQASQLKDSRTMEYKRFNDNHSLDTATAVNMSQKLESIALRKRRVVSEYQGLKGFFTSDVNPKEERLDHTSSQSFERIAAEEKFIFAGDNQWRPKSSLCECVDKSVEFISAHAQPQYRKAPIERILSPRLSNKRIMQQQQHTENRRSAMDPLLKVRRSNSAKSMTRNSKPFKMSRPSTTPRPISRAASEISEIESIDTTDQNDLLMDEEEEQEALTALDKELHALRSDSDSKKTQHQQISAELFPSVRHSKTSSEFTEKKQIQNYKFKNSSPMRAMESLEDCDGESESDDDEETLQDRLNVLSLQ